MNDFDIDYPPVATREEWLARRLALLEHEKTLTRQRDALNAERRRLPMVAIEKSYRFEGPAGHMTLPELFEGRRQLLVYHFMFDPDPPPPGKSGAPWDEGCEGCSLMADNLPHLSHFHARDTTLAMVSRAPLAKIEPFKARMGWAMPWYSSSGCDFNYDFHVTLDPERGSCEWNYRDAAELVAARKIPSTRGELPAVSVFLRQGERVFHTYSTYARGMDALVNTCNFLDLTPFGRGEGWDGMPDLDGQGMAWLRHHDRYGDPSAQPCHDRKIRR
jgi:predicted dithiol-disulfide oxidoreductase (DUF899 family)